MTGRGALRGRTALVTGASSGIGAAIARRFAEEGAQVHGLSRRTTDLELPGDVEGGFTAHAVDVTDLASVARTVEAIDGLDAVVLAAGTNVTDRRFGQLTEDSFEGVLRTNLHGAFSILRLALPSLRERSGDVVVISSIAATWPDHSGAAYGASKAGLLALARGLSRDEHEHGVRVCTILPGIVDTPILDRRPSPPPPEVRELAIHPDDIAEAALTAVSLPNRTNLAEISVVSTRLQSLGATQQATPTMPAAARTAASA